jgi:hypothetical protein
MTLKNFLFEGRDPSAFFAFYAGLRMYKEVKDLQTIKGKFYIAAAEAYCMLQDLKEQFPKHYAEAEAEYNEVYGKVKSITF